MDIFVSIGKKGNKTPKAAGELRPPWSITLFHFILVAAWALGPEFMFVGFGQPVNKPGQKSSPPYEFMGSLLETLLAGRGTEIIIFPLINRRSKGPARIQRGAADRIHGCFYPVTIHFSALSVF